MQNNGFVGKNAPHSKQKYSCSKFPFETLFCNKLLPKANSQHCHVKNVSISVLESLIWSILLMLINVIIQSGEKNESNVEKLQRHHIAILQLNAYRMNFNQFNWTHFQTNLPNGWSHLMHLQIHENRFASTKPMLTPSTDLMQSDLTLSSSFHPPIITDAKGFRRDTLW